MTSASHGVSAPTVSVVIPTYGHRDTVRATLDSVFAQTFADVEIIVVDDGSPDDTAALLQPLADAGRLTLVRQANAGQAAARNRGIALARGRYVALLDDDDLWPPDRLAWQVEVLEREPETVLVYGPCLRLHADGSTSPGPPGPHPSGRVHDVLLRRYSLTSPGQALVRGSALRAVGGFDPALWGVDDWDLYLRLARVGAFTFVDRVALHYRVHEGNASRDAVRHVRSAWRAMRKHAGWNPGVVLAQLRHGGGYFAPNLMRYAEAARRHGRRRDALTGYLYATVYRPNLLLTPWFVAEVGRTLLGVRPKG